MTALSQQFPLTTHQSLEAMPGHRVAALMRRVLAAAIAVMDQPSVGLPATYGHVQGVQDQLRAHLIGHRRAHQLPIVEAKHRRQIEPPFQRPDRRDIGHPGPIRCRHHELAVQQVGRHQTVLTVGRMAPAAPLTCLDTGFPH